MKRFRHLPVVGTVDHRSGNVVVHEDQQRQTEAQSHGAKYCWPLEIRQRGVTDHWWRHTDHKWRHEWRHVAVTDRWRHGIRIAPSIAGHSKFDSGSLTTDDVILTTDDVTLTTNDVMNDVTSLSLTADVTTLPCRQVLPASRDVTAEEAWRSRPWSPRTDPLKRTFKKAKVTVVYKNPSQSYAASPAITHVDMIRICIWKLTNKLIT